MGFPGFERTRRRSWLRIGLLTVAVAVTAAGTAEAATIERDTMKAGARPRTSRFTLTGHNPTFQIFGNLVQCGINNKGEVCTDVFDSPTGGGGFWPGGTLNQYIFNSGLQIVGIIDPSDPTNPWAGDTTGAFVFDPKGTEEHSSPRGGTFTGIWNSLDLEDQQTWPDPAIIGGPPSGPGDTAIFAPQLVFDRFGQRLNRRSASQLDTWVRYWEGDPNLIAGRPHPLGIEFDTRSLLWNFPAGNEDILYFIYVFRNISNDPEFQQLNEARFGIDIPDAGYTITDMFAAFAMDPDVGDDAGSNLTNAMLEFQLGVAYDADFSQPSPPFVFPSTIHGPPFFASTGFIGVKYLKSPTDPLTGEDVGLTLFTQTTNPSQEGGFKDATGVLQLYRYLSGNIIPGVDDPCSIPQSQVLIEKLCFVGAQPTDVRMVQSSGPFDLAPGEEATIVVAYIHAAPLAVPEYSQGQDLGNTLPNVDSVRTLDRMMGYDAPLGSPRVDTLPGERFEDVVPTVARSLLDKAKVAQAVFDGKFLLPFAPEPPRLTLVPGDRKVTVVWDPSATETLGDPFAEVALDTLNALCDLNYRRFDVEGYRVYKGTSAADLQVIAQFDFAGTQFADSTGRLDQSRLDPPSDCTDVFDPAAPVQHDILGRVIQFPPGGRVELSDGSVIVIKADTSPKPGQFPALEDNGVPFAFEDTDVVNGFRYVYAVTAFDINSIKSAPGSLESPRLPEAAVPRKEGTNQIAGNLAVRMFGDDGVDLDPNAPLPTFDQNTALFSGPQPPTNGIEYGFAGFVDKLAPPQGTFMLQIDSIIPGNPHEEAEGSTIPVPTIYHVTIDTKTGTVQAQIPLAVHYYSDAKFRDALFPGVAAVDSAARLYDADSTLTLFEKVTVRHPGNWRTTAFGRGAINGDPSRSKFSGARWFEGANETLPEPYAGYCPDLGGCDETNTDPNRTAGQLPGVDTLFSIQGYNSVPSNVREMEGVLSTVWRAADIEFVWGAGGTVQSVRDLTHHVAVPFSPKVRASWGFLTSASFATVDPATTPDVRNDVITYSDFTCMDPIPTFAFAQPGGSRDGEYCTTPVDLQQTALLDAVRAASSTFANTATLPATGTGFGLYINGRTFIFQLGQLPTEGTRWVLRTYAGPIRHASACGSPCVVPNADPYTWSPAVRPPAVPGLQFEMTFGGTQIQPQIERAIENVHPVPDPYYATSSFEVSPAGKVIRFINLPNRATIRIYSVSGILVSVIQHDDPAGSGEAIWNVRNLNEQFVASGVYFFHVVTPDGQQKIGRMTVVNFAQ